MLGSLRFRLPALFLIGIVLAAVVATIIAVRFFQSNTRATATSELRSTSAGIVPLYELNAGVGQVSRHEPQPLARWQQEGVLGPCRPRRLPARRSAAAAPGQRPA